MFCCPFIELISKGQAGGIAFLWMQNIEARCSRMLYNEHNRQKLFAFYCNFTLYHSSETVYLGAGSWKKRLLWCEKMWKISLCCFFFRLKVLLNLDNVIGMKIYNEIGIRMYKSMPNPLPKWALNLSVFRTRSVLENTLPQNLLIQSNPK